MRAAAIERRQSDSPAHFSLTWTGIASFLLFITRVPPDPGLFLPVAITALPFAAAPRHRIMFRILAAALLVGFVVARGTSPVDLAFTPAIAGLLLSAYGLYRGDISAEPRRRRRGRRSRRS